MEEVLWCLRATVFCRPGALGISWWAVHPPALAEPRLPSAQLVATTCFACCGCGVLGLVPVPLRDLKGCGLTGGGASSQTSCLSLAFLPRSQAHATAGLAPCVAREEAWLLDLPTLFPRPGVTGTAACRVWQDRSCFGGTPAEGGGLEGVGSQGNIGVGYSAGKIDGEICSDSHKRLAV